MTGMEETVKPAKSENLILPEDVSKNCESNEAMCYLRSKTSHVWTDRSRRCESWAPSGTGC